MDILTFISSLIGSLAWPIIILIIFLLFKEQLSNILKNLKLKRIKKGEFEIDFDKELMELKTKSEKLGISKELKDDLAKLNEGHLQLAADEQIELISQINPSSAIALSWSNVEREILNAIYRLAISPDYPAYNSPLKNIQLLRLNSKIDKNEFEILNRLRVLRNEAIHNMDSSSLTLEDVEEFNLLSKNILRKLKNLKR